MEVKASESIKINIYIAGNYDKACDAIRKYFFKTGGCVTITKTNYVYSAGEEDGVIIGLINYPRFPKIKETLLNEANKLANYLREELCQDSYTIDDGETATFTSYRDERGKNEAPGVFETVQTRRNVSN